MVFVFGQWSDKNGFSHTIYHTTFPITFDGNALGASGCLMTKGSYYSGQFRRLAQQILRCVYGDWADGQAGQEMDAELDWEHAFDSCVPQQS
jgi:hypothetical protein